jgi:CRP-like cAMP-binding protein
MQEDSVAAEAIARTWPMALAETRDRLVLASSLVERPGGALMTQGESPSRVCLILSGAFVATWTAPDGRIAQGRIVQVDASGPGLFLGVTTLTGGPIVTGIDALSEVTMLTWPSHEFRAITDLDPALTLTLLDLAVYAIQLLNRIIQLRTFTTAASRLAGLLLEYEGFIFATDVPLVSRGQLPALAGVTPQMVSRIVRRWEAAGIVRRVGASGLELLDRDALGAKAAPLADFPVPDRPRRALVLAKG